MSINTFVRGVGVGVTHTEKLLIRKFKKVSKINGLDEEQEDAEPAIDKNSKLNLKDQTKTRKRFNHRQRFHLVGQDQCNLHNRRHEL